MKDIINCLTCMDHSTVLAKAFLVFIIWDMGGDEISAGFAKLVIQRSSVSNYC